MKCSPTCRDKSDIYTFNDGKDYLYDLDLSHSHINSTRNAVTFAVKGQARVQVLSRCEFALQLTLSSIKGNGYDGINKKAQWEGKPLRFGWDDGKITALCPERMETEEALNIKRGVLSMLQLTLDDLQSPSYHIERDVAGECYTQYSIGSATNDLLKVEKKKNVAGCANRYAYDSNSAGFSINIPKETSQAPLVEGEQACTYSVNARGPPQSVNCEENHILLSVTDSSFSSNTVITVKQKLQYVQTEANLKVNIKPESRTDLLYESPRDVPTLFSSSATKADGLISMINAAKVQTSESSSQWFLRFVYTLRGASLSELTTVRDKVDESSMSLFYDAIGSTQTDASVALILDTLQTKPAHKSYVEGFIISANFVRKPTAKIISDLQALYSNANYRGISLLVTSSLINKYCAQNPSCFDNSDIKTAFQRIIQSLSEACTSKDEEKAIQSLKALKNVGRLQDDQVDVVETCYNQFKEQTRVIVALVEAVRNLPCEFDTIQFNILNTIVTGDGDTEARVKAYLSLIQCPTQEVVSNILKTITYDRNQQFSSYVWSHLNSVLASKDSFTEPIRQVFASNSSLQSNLQKLSSQLNLDSLTHSKYYDRTMQVYGDVESRVQSSVIFGRNSFMPQFANVNVTMNMFGRSVNVLDIGVNAEGLEDLFIKAKKFLDRRRRQLVDKLSQEFKSKDNDYPKRGPSSLSVSVSIFGNEILFTQNLYSDTSKSAVMATLQKLLSGEMVDLAFKQRNLLTESTVTFPSSSGFPVHLQLFTACTADVTVRGSFKNQDFRLSTYLSPKFSVYAVTRFFVDSGDFNVGVTSEINMHSNVSLSGALEWEMQNKDKKSFFKFIVDPIESKENIFSIKRQIVQNYGKVSQMSLGRFASVPSEEFCSAPSIEQLLGVSMCVVYSKARASNQKGERENFFYEVSIQRFRGYNLLAEYQPSTLGPLPAIFKLELGHQKASVKPVLIDLAEVKDGYKASVGLPYVGTFDLDVDWKMGNALKGSFKKDGKELLQVNGFKDQTTVRVILKDDKADWVVFETENKEKANMNTAKFTLNKVFPMSISYVRQTVDTRKRYLISADFLKEYTVSWKLLTSNFMDFKQKEECEMNIFWTKNKKPLLNYDARIGLEFRDGRSARELSVSGKLLSVELRHNFTGEAAAKVQKFGISTGFTFFISDGAIKGEATLQEPVLIESDFKWQYPYKVGQDASYTFFLLGRKAILTKGNYTFLMEANFPDPKLSYKHFAQLAWNSSKSTLDQINFQIMSTRLMGESFNLQFNHEMSAPNNIKTTFKLDIGKSVWLIRSQLNDLTSHNLLVNWNGAKTLLKSTLKLSPEGQRVKVVIAHDLVIGKDKAGSGQTTVYFYPQEARGEVDLAFTLTKAYPSDLKFKSTIWAKEGVELSFSLESPVNNAFYRVEVNQRMSLSNVFNSRVTVDLSPPTKPTPIGYDLRILQSTPSILFASNLTIFTPSRPPHTLLEFSLGQRSNQNFLLRLKSFSGDELYIMQDAARHHYLIDLSNTLPGIYYEEECKQEMLFTSQFHMTLAGRSRWGSRQAPWENYIYKITYNSIPFHNFELVVNHDKLKQLGLSDVTLQGSLFLMPEAESLKVVVNTSIGWQSAALKSKQYVELSYEQSYSSSQNVLIAKFRVNINIANQNHKFTVEDEINWSKDKFSYNFLTSLNINGKEYFVNNRLAINVQSVTQYQLQFSLGSSFIDYFKELTISSVGTVNGGKPKRQSLLTFKTASSSVEFKCVTNLFAKGQSYFEIENFKFEWNSKEMRFINNGEIEGGILNDNAFLKVKVTPSSAGQDLLSFNANAAMKSPSVVQLSLLIPAAKLELDVMSRFNYPNGAAFEMTGRATFKAQDMINFQLKNVTLNLGETSSYSHEVNFDIKSAEPFNWKDKAHMQWKSNQDGIFPGRVSQSSSINGKSLSEFFLDVETGKFVWEFNVAQFLSPSNTKTFVVSISLPSVSVNDFSFTGTVQLDPYISKTFLKVDLFNGFVTNSVRKDPKAGDVKFQLGFDLNTDYAVVDRVYSYFSLIAKSPNTHKADFYYEFASSLLDKNALKGYFTSEVTLKASGIEATLKADDGTAYSVQSSWQSKEFKFTLKDLKGVKVPINLEVTHNNAWVPITWKLEVEPIGKITGFIKDASKKADGKQFSFVWLFKSGSGAISSNGTYADMSNYKVKSSIQNVKEVNLNMDVSSQKDSSTNGNMVFNSETKLEYAPWSCKTCNMKLGVKGRLLNWESYMQTIVNGMDRLKYAEEVRLDDPKNIKIRMAVSYPDLVDQTFEVQRNGKVMQLLYQSKLDNVKFEISHDYESSILSATFVLPKRSFVFRTNVFRVIDVFLGKFAAMQDPLMPVGFVYSFQINNGYFNFSRLAASNFSIQTYFPDIMPTPQPLVAYGGFTNLPYPRFAFFGGFADSPQDVLLLIEMTNLLDYSVTFNLEKGFRMKNKLRVFSSDGNLFELAASHDSDAYKLDLTASYSNLDATIQHNFSLKDGAFMKVIHSSSSKCNIKSLLVDGRHGVCFLEVDNGQKLRLLKLVKAESPREVSSFEFAWDKRKFGFIAASIAYERPGETLAKLLTPARNFELKVNPTGSVRLTLSHHSGRADKNAFFQLDVEGVQTTTKVSFSSSLLQDTIVTSFSITGASSIIEMQFKRAPKPFFKVDFNAIKEDDSSWTLPVTLAINDKIWKLHISAEVNPARKKFVLKILDDKNQDQVYQVDYNTQKVLIQATDKFLFEWSYVQESFSSLLETILHVQPDNQKTSMRLERNLAPFKFIWQIKTNERTIKLHLRAVSQRAFMGTLTQVIGKAGKSQDVTFNAEYTLQNNLNWQLTWRENFVTEYRTLLVDATNPDRLSRVLTYYQRAFSEQRQAFLSEFGRPFVAALNIGDIIDFAKAVVNDVEDSWKEVGRVYENNDFYLKSIFGGVGGSKSVEYLVSLPQKIQYSISNLAGQPMDFSGGIAVFQSIHSYVKYLLNQIDMSYFEKQLQSFANLAVKLFDIWASSFSISSDAWSTYILEVDISNQVKYFTDFFSSLLTDDTWAYLNGLLQELKVVAGKIDIAEIKAALTKVAESLSTLPADLARFTADLSSLLQAILINQSGAAPQAQPSETNKSITPEYKFDLANRKITYKSYVPPAAIAYLTSASYASQYVPNEVIRSSQSSNDLFFQTEYLALRYGSKDKALSFLPPYSKTAWVVNNEYYVTFDGAAGHIVPGCRYLLSRDFRNKRFSVLMEVKTDSTSVLYLQYKDSTYSLESNGKFSVVGQAATNLPYFDHDKGVEVIRDGQMVQINVKKLLSVSLYTSWLTWSVKTEGVLQGQVDGLLGSNNFLLADDYFDAQGQNTEANTARLRSWTTQSCANINAFPVASYPTKSDAYACEQLFRGRSHLKRCFGVVDPRPYDSICARYESKTVPSQSSNLLCNLEKAYVQECQSRGVTVRARELCSQCSNSRAIGAIVPSPSTPTLNRYIFVLEQSKCVESEKAFIKKLAGSLAGSSEDEFTLITFDSKQIYQVTMALTQSQSTLVNFEAAVDSHLRVTHEKTSNKVTIQAIQTAISLATGEKFKDHILLFTCSKCAPNRNLNLGTMMENLRYSGIALHHFTAEAIQNDGIEGIFGLDSTKYFRNVANKKVQEDSKTKDMRPPKDECSSLALNSNGAVWSIANNSKEALVAIYRRIKWSQELNKLQQICSCRVDRYGQPEVECVAKEY